MKITELRQKSPAELQKMLPESREKLRLLRFDLAAGKVKNIREANMFGNPGFRIGIEFVNVDKDMVMSILNEIQANICQGKRGKWETMGTDIGPL